MKVHEIMTRPVPNVRPNTRIADAVYLLTQQGASALPVVDDRRRVVGIFSEADALATELADGDANGTVDSVMTTAVRVTSPDADVAEVAQRMLVDRLRCLPIVAGDMLCGVVTRRDVLLRVARPGARSTMGMTASGPSPSQVRGL